MPTEKQFSDVLSGFAHLTAADPIQQILDHLVHGIVDILPITAAGATLFASGTQPRYVAASNEAARRCEHLQAELDEGPGLAAFDTGEAIALPDLRSESRFPAFAAGAIDTGLSSVFTVPLRRDDTQLGALDLYRDAPPPLDDPTMAAQTLADVAAAYLHNARAQSDREVNLQSDLQRACGPRHGLRLAQCLGPIDGWPIVGPEALGPPPRVLIVEDHELLTQLLIGAFQDVGIDDVTAARPDEMGMDALLDLTRRIRPDVVLLDLDLGSAGTGMRHIGPLMAAGSTVLILSANDDPAVLGECLEAGAAGILSKIEPFETLAAKVRRAAHGGATISVTTREALLADLRRHRRTERGARQPFEGLTGRERVVLAGLVRGTTAEQIAAQEHVTLATVRSQIRGVLRKLGVNSQLLAVAMAHDADWNSSD